MYEVLIIDRKHGNVVGVERTDLETTKDDFKKLVMNQLSEYVKSFDDIVFDEYIINIQPTAFKQVLVRKISAFNYQIFASGNERGEEYRRDVLIREVQINELI